MYEGVESGDLKLFENASCIVIPTGTTTVVANFQNNTNITSLRMQKRSLPFQMILPLDVATKNVTPLTLCGALPRISNSREAFKRAVQSLIQ